MPAIHCDAQVTAAHFDGAGQAWFTLGDGTVRGWGLPVLQAHDGAVLCSVEHPCGRGVITGGDDGRVCWSHAGGVEPLYARPGRWIDAVAASAASGLVAFAAAREVQVRDPADAGFQRTFVHERAVAALAFEPKGRRLAAATYGGVRLWYARIAEQKPQVLKWAGSHVGAAWSPNGRFVVSAMQENALHGWRLSDAKDMRMGGYPAKVRSLAFLAGGQMLATGGAQGAVVWPFAGADGPMGKEASEIGYEAGAEVARVAAAPAGRRLAAGLADGRVWVADLAGGGVHTVAAASGAAIAGLAMSADGRRLAYGDEAGRMEVVALDFR